MECRKQKARNWQVRLLEQVKTMGNGKFVTLTFSNESITKLAAEIPNLEGYPLDNAIATLAVRRFLERWRKKFKKSVLHWLITELGQNGTENIHLHGILWTDVNGDDVQELWQYGYIWRGYEQEPKLNGWSKKLYVNQATVNYITKYIFKADEKHKNYVPKILCSSGIGSNYENSYNATKNKFNGEGTKETYRTNNGQQIALPTYYRNKLYSEEEREKLWLQTLDKEKRYVMGIEVDANDYKTYMSLLKKARTLNTQLGYGDDSKNWHEQLYESERRKLLLEKRKENIKKSTTRGAGNSKDIR